MPIIIPIEIDNKIREHARQAYPNECCGFMLGTQSEPTKKEVSKLIPIDNSRESEEQYHRFEIKPEEFIKAEIQAEKDNLEVLGFYHSHPNAPAKPSEYDRDHAFPFYSYVIVSVKGGDSPSFPQDKDLTSWQLSAERIFESEVVCQA
ncbi:hypothetical protein AGMMS49938_13050 [Fibrobacterales bacterium]|nr:hypothetical protein AGMMS49938_13050 [Fibrobacterales bacterium]